MSDTEGTKKSGYRLEYATSNRSKCKGPKPCSGTTIAKGELRVGTIVDFRGNTTFVYRHWGCVTPKIITNMKQSFEEADELDGFEELKDEDQERVQKAWADGHVADEDIPESARKPVEEGDGDEDEDEKPKKKAGAKAKKVKEKEDASAPPKKGTFSLEYAVSGRSKCKDCSEMIAKGIFRLGLEQDFRGKPATSWHHWGCLPPKLVVALQASYDEPSAIPGFSNLKDDAQAKVKRALDAGEVPENDKGVGEAVDTGKKKAAPRRRKKADDDDDEDLDEEEEVKPKRNARARKVVKKDEDDDEDEEEEVVVKPAKKRAAPVKKVVEKKPVAKNGKAPAKKAAPRKKKPANDDDDDDDDENFGDAIDAVPDDEDDDVEEEEKDEEEKVPNKRKRAPPSKGASSKAQASKRAKPASSRIKKKQEIAEEDEDDYD